VAQDISKLVDYLRTTKDAAMKAYVQSLLSFLTQAEAQAKRNATRQFTGRRGRKLSGRLLNSIYTALEIVNGKPKGVIGTRGIPYGAIHEFGGDITPKKAKNLWVKQWGGKADKFRRLTPTEFIKLKEQNPSQYKIFRSQKNNLIAAYTPTAGEVVPLFVLRQRVTIPERPYIRPAVETALKGFPEKMRQNIRKQFLGI
jgi:phage gpG-like protein